MIFNSQDKNFKYPLGAVKEYEKFTLKLKFKKSYYIQNPFLVICKADDWYNYLKVPLKYESSQADENIYSVEHSIFSKGLYFYYFSLLIDGRECFIRRNNAFEGVFSDTREGWNYFQLTVCDKEMETNGSLKDGIMYQIFPDRFFNSGKIKENVPKDRKLRNDFENLPDYLPDANGFVTNSDYFCGDLEGIIMKLEYMESLGVSVIYLNPIFEAHSNHRYNTANYFKIDPLLGTEDNFKKLCEKAHEKGIRVILDGVFNHTGDDSIYFNKNNRYETVGASNSKESEYFDWYTFYQYPHNYHSWWGFCTLPTIKKNSFSFLNYICGEGGVIDHWMSLGADGFRLDVADELSDEMLDSIKMAVKRHGKDKCVIGEVWEDASNKCAFNTRRKYLTGDELDSVMNYPFQGAILNYVKYGYANDFYLKILSICENYPKSVLNVLMNSLSTHDTIRALTECAIDRKGYSKDRKWQAENDYIMPSDYEYAKKRLKLATLFQYFLPGIPCIYYGDEAGLYGYKDPFNRKFYPWGREDKDLLNFYKELGAIRKNSTILGEAEFNFLEVNNDYCLFERCLKQKKLVIVINRSDKAIFFDTKGEYSNFKLLFRMNDSNNKLIYPLSGIVLASD